MEIFGEGEKVVRIKTEMLRRAPYLIATRHYQIERFRSSKRCIAVSWCGIALDSKEVLPKPDKLFFLTPVSKMLVNE